MINVPAGARVLLGHAWPIDFLKRVHMDLPLWRRRCWPETRSVALSLSGAASEATA